MSKSHHRALLRVLPEGYTIGYPEATGGGPSEATRKIGRGSGHPYVLDAVGSPLRGANGLPIKVSSTPGKARTLYYDVARIRKALRRVGIEPRG